jgi:phage shock protein PspC (stress-responsive transcriptional regulator)
VAERYGWNVTLVRVVWLVLAALPVLPGAVVYVALWALVPIEEPIRQPGR